MDTVDILEEQKILYTKDGKIRKRRPKNKRDYFTQQTEDAIIKYMNTESQAEREKIYNNEIRDSMDKLVECIANSFKFDYVKQEAIDIKDVEKETLSYLYEIFKHYKKENGKAYSYFGTVAKRRLIKLNKEAYKDRQEVTNNLDEIDTDKKTKRRNIETDHTSDFQHFVKSFSAYLKQNLDSLYPGESERLVATCFVDLLDNAGELESFNKKVIYFLIKEKTGVKTYDITKTLAQLYLDMKDQQAIYYLTGGELFIKYKSPFEV